MVGLPDSPAVPAAPPFGPQAQPAREIRVGDFLPDFQLYNQRGAVTMLFKNARGRHILLLFYPDGSKPFCQQMLRSFAALQPQIEALAQVFAINNEPPEANARWASLEAMPFDFLLSDQQRQAARAYGVAHNLSEVQDFTGMGAFTSVVADANRRVLRIDRDVTDTEHAARILAFLEAQPRPEPRVTAMVAPVLCVPRVIEPELCTRLIEAFDSGQPVSSGTQSSNPDGSGREVINPEVKIRRDLTIDDPVLHGELAAAVGARVLPEIAKAFYYRATSLESFRVVCYDAQTGGYFRTHRDNTNISTAHRRFAMTLNLNTGDYEGGQLRFPEYGPDLYMPGRGDAVIFSCALLHEAMPVTAGKRYVVLAFLYGADGQRLMEARPKTLR